MIGRIIAHYRILRQIGAGGMGVVYEAEDTTLGRRVALKFLSGEISREPNARERFLREARAAASLNHHNICTVHAVGDYEGHPFIAMELLDGTSLREHLARGPILPDIVVDWALQIAEALETAHAQGIVHRDIKPGNLQITARGSLKLLDFGLARWLHSGGVSASSSVDTPTLAKDQLTARGATVGTPPYMSPEQISGDAVDARTDIYSTGIVLYEAATGRHPFGGRTVANFTDEILQPQPVAPTRLNPKLPAELERIILRAMETDPSLRYQSAADLKADVARLRRDLSARARGKPPESASPKSLAVLPFQNLSPDPEQEYFCDGLTDELITTLSGLSPLLVISRTSVMRLKGSAKDLRSIAHELGVRYVVEGSVRKAGRDLRINAQLIDATTDVQLWAERFHGVLDDVFDVQERVSRSIADSLDLKLSLLEVRRLTERTIRDAAAYECFLRARTGAWTFRADELERAGRELENALRIEGPNERLYALQGLVALQFVEAGLGGVDRLEEAEAHVRKIFELDPDSPHGFALRGMIHRQRGDLQHAVRDLKRVLPFNPNDPDVLRVLLYCYALSGQYGASFPMSERLLKVDPLTPLTQCMPGMLPLFEGRFAEALPYYERAARMDPENPALALFLSWVLLLAGRPEDAAPGMERLARAAPRSPIAQAGCFLQAAWRGQPEEARRSATPELNAAARRVEYLARSMWQGHALLGNRQEALEWLKIDIGLGFIHYDYLARYDPCLAELRSDERFQRLLAEVRERAERFEV